MMFLDSALHLFSSSRVLRQGDLSPLLSLLFVVVMEVLSKMLTATVDRGLLYGN
jgi:hypothetical protein